MAISDKRLRAIIELMVKGDDKTKRALKDVASETKGVSRQTSLTTKASDGMRAALGGIAIAAGTAGAAMFAAKKAFDFAKEGAQIATVRDTFDKLTTSIGETSDAILGELRQATAGMVADTELMASANRFLSMGLANTGDQAAELARIAVTLGSAMGKDATSAMEEFALLLANQSIPRLDTFGISAGKVRERIADLQDANKGMSRETAFMTAVMEEAQISMDKLGDSVPVNPYQQFEVQTKNLTDQLKILAAEGLGPVVEGAVDVATQFTEEIRLTNKLAQAVEDGIITHEEFTRAANDVADGSNDATEAMQWLEIRVDMLTQRERELIEAQKDWNTELYLSAVLTNVHLSPALLRAIAGTQDLGKAFEVLHHQTFEQVKAANAYGKAWADAADEQRGTTDIIDAMRAATAAQAKAVNDIIDGGLTLFNEELDELGPKMVTWGGRTADQNRLLDQMQDEVDGLNRKIADAQAAPELFGGLDEANKVIENATDRINELTPAIARLSGITSEFGMVNVDLTVDFDKLNDAAFDNVRATAANADEIKRLGIEEENARQKILDLAVATGELTQQQADAITQQILLEAAIQTLTDAYLTNELSADNYALALADVANGLFATASQAVEAYKAVDNVQQSLDMLDGDYYANINLDVHNLGDLERAWQLAQNLLGSGIMGGIDALNQTGQSSDQQAQEASGVGEAYSGTTPAPTPQGYTPSGQPQQLYNDANFYVGGSQPYTASFSPGDYVVAQKTPINGGGTTINIDARGASPGVADEVERAVRMALIQAGIRANARTRTI